MEYEHDGIANQCRVVWIDRTGYRNPPFPLVVIVSLATIFKYDDGVTGFGFYGAFALVASLGIKSYDCDAFGLIGWPVGYEKPNGILRGGV